MRVAVALAVLMLAACEQASTPAAAVPTPANSPSAAATVWCRLPVVMSNSGGGYHDAFLDTRTGTVTIDPTVMNGLYYDSVLARWLPVDRYGVSPDHRQYASGGGTPDLKPILHIVDVDTGVDHVYPLPPELAPGLGGPMVLGFTSTSIYIGDPGEGAMGALWTFDLATHRTTYTNVTGLGVIDGTTAWRSTLDSSDATAWSWPGTPRANQIERLDLATGAHTLWLRSPGHLLDVVGVDTSGRPVVRDYIDRQNVELLVLAGPATAEVIFKGSADTWAAYLSGMSSDSHGIWFGGDKGVHLFTTTGRLIDVSDETLTPAGDCQPQS